MIGNKKIAIIGGGNLGSSVAYGLLKKNIKPENLIITRRKIELLNDLKNKGVNVIDNNIEAVRKSEIIIIAVKPYNFENILLEIKDELNSEKHLIISLVSKVSIDDIKSTIDKKISIFRAAPNTAIAVNESMTCISQQFANQEQIDIVEYLFNMLGETLLINEEMSNASTVLAACGTAFAMRFIRAMVQGGIEIGFSSQNASLIAMQTVKGAADLLLQNKTHPEFEIDRVTTPKGYTISGLNEMEHNGFSSSLIKGILTSYNKIISEEK